MLLPLSTRSPASAHILDHELFNSIDKNRYSSRDFGLGTFILSVFLRPWKSLLNINNGQRGVCAGCSDFSIFVENNMFSEVAESLSFGKFLQHSEN